MKPETSSWADLAKKVVFSSLGSASMAKNLVTDGTMQKQIISGLLGEAQKRKDELLNVLAKEVSSFLSKLNVGEEITKALKGLVVNLSATVDFSEKKGSRATLKKTSARKKK